MMMTMMMMVVLMVVVVVMVVVVKSASVYGGVLQRPLRDLNEPLHQSHSFISMPCINLNVLITL